MPLLGRAAWLPLLQLERRELRPAGMRGGWAGMLLLLLLVLLLPLKRRAWLTESAVQGWSQETFSLWLVCSQDSCLL